MNDDLLALLAAEDEQQQSREEIVVATPDYDPIRLISLILENHPLETVSPHNFPQNLARLYLGGIDYSVKLTSLNSVSQDLGIDGYTGTFKERIQKARASMWAQVHSTLDCEVEVMRRTARPVEKLTQPPHFLPLKPEVLLAASEIAQYLPKNGRLTRARTISDLNELIVLEGISNGLEEDHQGAVQEILADDTASMLEVISSSLLIGKIENPLSALRKHQTIVGMRKDAFSEIKDEGATFHGSQPSFDGISLEIYNQVRDQLGIYIFRDPLPNPDDYSKFKEHLLNHVLKGWEIDENDQDFHDRDHVVTFQAMGRDGVCYSRGHSLEKTPLGTVGRLDYDNDFVPNLHGGYIRLAFEELKKLKKRTLPGDPPSDKIQVGDKVKLNAGEYTYTTVGSWGYVTKITKYWTYVNFHYVPDYDGKIPRQWDVKSKHLEKMEQRSPLEQAIYENEIQFETGDQVKIQANSPFADETQSVGTITDVMLFAEDGSPYMIEFEDGFTHRYKPGDLEFVNDPKRWTEKLAAIQRQREELIQHTEQTLNIIVDTAELPLREYETQKAQFTTNAQDRLHKLGIYPGLSSWLMRTIMPKCSETPDVFDEINELQASVHFQECEQYA